MNCVRRSEIVVSMAQAISGSLRSVAAQQLLFPQFHQRRARNSHSLVLSDSRDTLGNEVVRGKGYLLLVTKRSNSSAQVNFTPLQRPKTQGKSHGGRVTYIPLVGGQNSKDRSEPGFEVMKRLSRLRRRKARESEWSPDDTSFHIPPKPKRLQISLVLPSGTSASEGSEDSAVDTYKKRRPHSRAVSSVSGSELMRRRIEAVPVDSSSPVAHIEKPMIRFSPSKGERHDEDLRKSLYKIRRTPRV